MPSKWPTLLLGVAAIVAGGGAGRVSFPPFPAAPRGAATRQASVGSSSFTLLSSYFRPRRAAAAGRPSRSRRFLPRFRRRRRDATRHRQATLTSARRLEKLVFITIKPARLLARSGRTASQTLRPLSRTRRMEPSRRACRARLPERQSVRRPGALFRRARGARLSRRVAGARISAQDAQFLRL